MDYSTFDDVSLIRLIAAKRSDALGVLYDRYGKLVYSIAYNATSDPEAAEEITQDVFIRVWEKALTYDLEVAKVSTWLISIARNRSIDEIRRTRARPEGRSASWEEALENYFSDSVSPEEETILALEQQMVRSAVNSLPVEQKKVLALAYFQGMTHSEIAEAIGEPLGTVKTRIRLGLQKIRQLLGEKITQEK